MKLRLLIQIAVVVSIVLLCTGFGVYSFLQFGGEPAGFQSLYFGAARCHSHTRNRPYGRPRGGYQ